MKMRSILSVTLLLSLIVPGSLVNANNTNSAIKSQFLSWAQGEFAVLKPHLQAGSQAFISDAKTLGTLAKEQGIKAIQAGIKNTQYLGGRVLGLANKCIDDLPAPVSIYLGLAITASTAGVVESYQYEQTRSKRDELSYLMSYLMTYLAGSDAMALKAFEPKETSIEVKEALEMVKLLIDSREHNIQAHDLACGKLHAALIKDRNSLNGILPRLVFLSGLTSMAAIAAHKTGLISKAVELAGKIGSSSVMQSAQKALARA